MIFLLSFFFFGGRAQCEDRDMVAFGHNDIVADNAYIIQKRGTNKQNGGMDRVQGGDSRLELGLFDWQQSCVNNVGQEWAWNFHFLPPCFLDEHESEFIDLILQTYKDQVRKFTHARTHAAVVRARSRRRAVRDEVGSDSHLHLRAFVCWAPPGHCGVP